MDVVNAETRSRMMAGIKAKDTKPEMLVRRFLHANGYRFRLHRDDLPGCPDVVLPRLKTCIFVHGCFWHQHSNCRYAKLPKTRPEFWAQKLQANVERDLRAELSLRQRGWRVLTVWECELRHSNDALVNLLVELEAIP